MKYDQPFRVGHGFDLHRLKPGRPLIVSGCRIDHDMGCAAHSDGDVVYHAVTDALLGAIGQEDIGQLFPDDDPAWKNADSSIFIAEAAKRVRNAGYSLGNLDVTVILQRPKLADHKRDMARHLEERLRCGRGRVNLKCKTHESVDAIGEGKAIACHCVVLLIKN